MRVFLLVLLTACGAPVGAIDEEIQSTPSAACLVCPPPGSLACAVKVSSTRRFEVDYASMFQQAYTYGLLGGIAQDSTYYETGNWNPTYAGEVHPFTYYSASTCGAYDYLCFAAVVNGGFNPPTAVRVVDRNGVLASPPLVAMGFLRCVSKSWW